MKSIITIICLLALILNSCTKQDYYDGDHFFIESKGATMPVIIKGNIESKTFIIFLHGGPGGNASLPSFMPVSKELEKDFAFAYWDQRGSGLSQGNPSASTFTVDQFVEDLDLVIQGINLRHNNPKIILYGISWGGALGCAYLSTGNHQDKVTAFVNMDSGHNLVEGLPKSVLFAKEYAENQISKGIDVDYWTEARNWCSNEPDMTNKDNFFKFLEYLNNTNAYQKDPNQNVEGPVVGFQGSTSSYLSLSVFFNGKYLVPNFNILELNLSAQMEKIKTPTLVIWGRHDGINTIEMGFDAFNSIGGPGFTEKEMVILENSAHSGYIEEQDLFISSFRNFVSTL